MLLGLMNASFTLQKNMDQTFQNISYVRAYLDVIVVFPPQYT